MTFGNSNYGNTPDAAAFRPMKLRASPWVYEMPPDNLFMADIKWPRRKFYAKPQSLVTVIITHLTITITCNWTKNFSVTITVTLANCS